MEMKPDHDIAMAIAKSGTEFQGVIKLNEAQRAAIQKITGIDTGSLQVGILSGLVVAMPSASSW